MGEPTLRPLELPAHPALGARAFRALRRWRRGPGRWAGRFACLVGILLVVWFFAQENIILANCTNPDDRNQCLGDAAATTKAVWAAGFLCMGFLVATWAAGVLEWQRFRVRRRSVAQVLPSSRPMPSEAPAGLLAAQRALTDPTLDHAQAAAARDNLLVWTALLVPAIFTEITQTYRYHYATGGTIETSYDIALLRFHFGLTLLLLLLAWRGLRAGLRLRAAAKTLYDEALRTLAEQEQAFDRLARGEPVGAPPPASFRPWAPRLLPKG
ncbi:MAG: hypothetical protein HYT80_05685 [Euryarchaeota archaeon]|nr:hypothetical protein [Euryarchaeota archaeon]